MRIYVIENPSADILEQVLSLLPEWRKETAERFMHVDDKLNCGLSYLLLQYALYMEFGFFETERFDFGEIGKPYLSKHKDVFFSISHCRTAICCCAGKTEMGVDIQDIRKYSFRTAKRVCTENELALLDKAENSDRLFSEIWSVKESVGKMTGKGFGEGFPQIDSLLRIKNKSSSVYEAADYFISLSIKNSFEEIETEKVDVTFLLSFLQQRL
ncbi:MAG: 4'-phosphopantetheinyl transferase family protein [Ruminiclostridium sp.]